MLDELADGIQVREQGNPDDTALIYLPGLHGDWTLAASFRAALIGSAVRFIEITYPRTIEWSLADYAKAVQAALAQRGITSGWLLGESFGSQVAWAMAEKFVRSTEASARTFQIKGIILAGGFVTYLPRWKVRAARTVFGAVPHFWVRAFLRFYSAYARVRHRRAAKTRRAVREFVERRTAYDIAAMRHRLSLIAGADFREVAGRVRFPVFSLSGFFDPIVFFPRVVFGLAKDCPGFRGRRMIFLADHNVLATSPDQAVAQVLRWLDQRELDGGRSSVSRTDLASV